VRRIARASSTLRTSTENFGRNDSAWCRQSALKSDSALSWGASVLTSNAYTVLSPCQQHMKLYTSSNSHHKISNLFTSHAYKSVVACVCFVLWEEQRSYARVYICTSNTFVLHIITTLITEKMDQNSPRSQKPQLAWGYFRQAILQLCHVMEQSAQFTILFLVTFKFNCLVNFTFKVLTFQNFTCAT